MKNNAFKYLHDDNSLSSKQKEDWYVNAADSIIEFATSLGINNKSVVEKDFKLGFGEVDLKFIKEALRPYIPVEEKSTLDEGHYLVNPGTAIEDAGVLPSYLPNIDFMNQIKDRFIGEYIRHYTDFQTYNRDPSAVLERNQALEKHIRGLIQELIMKLIEERMDEEDAAEIDIEKEEKKFTEEWVDKKTIQYQARLNLLNDETKAEMKYIEGFLYWFTTEHCYSYRDIVDGKLRKEIVNPLEYYRIPGSLSRLVKDDIAGVRKYQLNVREIIALFQDKLDKEDIDYIKGLVENGSSTGEYIVNSDMIMSRQIYNRIGADKGDLLTQYNFATTTGDVNVYHIVMHATTPIKILTYRDLDDTIKELKVDREYEMDEELGDIHLRTHMTTTVIEFYRFGDQHVGVYTKPEPVKVQNGFLPYNGITGYLGTMICNPIPRRVSGLLALYKYYTLQQQRAVAKYKNWMIIPDSVLQDSADMTREERLEYAKLDDVLFIADDEVNANTLQAIKSLVMQGAERYIEMISGLRKEIRSEALDAAGMNEQRYGDAGKGEGKAVTEYAITRATTASIGMFNTYNIMKEEDAMLDLAYAHELWKRGYRGSYFDKNTNKIVYVDIPAEDYPADIGVFVKNGIKEEEKKQAFKELAFNMSQNGEPLIAVEALGSENATDIKRTIIDSIRHKEELEMQMRKYEEQMKVQAQTLMNENEELTRQHEIELLIYKEEMANIRNTLDNDTKILDTMLKLEGSNSSEIEKRKFELEERKQQLKESESKLSNYLNMQKERNRAKEASQRKQASA